MISIHANAQACNINASVTNGCTPLQVTFMDTSGNHGTWDFEGNGYPISNLDTADYIFTFPGTYFVKRRVNGDSCTIAIHVLAPPQLNFNVTDSLVCNDTVCNLKKINTVITQGSAPVTSYLVSYGDGIVDSFLSATHCYHGGTYSMSITLADTNGCGTYLSRTVHGYINPYIFLSTISPNDTVLCNTGNVMFDRSILSNDGYRAYWLVAPGDTQFSSSFTRYFYPDSTYTIYIHAQSYNGCIINDSVKVKVVDTPSGFSASSTFSYCPPLPISFSTNALGNYQNALWNFGDGDTSTDVNPLHIYTYPDTFTVSLTITDTINRCSHTITNTNLITVLGPSGVFNVSEDTGTIPFNVTITGTTNQVSVLELIWGDGSPVEYNIPATHTYTNPGNAYPGINLFDANACKVAYLVDTIICLQGVGMQEIKDLDKIYIYPNPTEDKLNITLPDEMTTLPVTLQVINATGQVVLSQKANAANVNSLNVSTIPKGIYVLLAESNGRVLRTNFVKQ
jgi:PKD repeat protein